MPACLCTPLLHWVHICILGGIKSLHNDDRRRVGHPVACFYLGNGLSFQRYLMQGFLARLVSRLDSLLPCKACPCRGTFEVEKWSSEI